MWLAISTGLVLGISASGHCVGMCGPIAMVLPFRSTSGAFRWPAFGLYHMGRLGTYAGLGALIGSFGFMLPWQQSGAWLSILSGAFLAGYALHYAGLIRFSLGNNAIGVLGGFTGYLWTRVRSGSTLWFLPAGVANGLLPCGMVYAAAAAALGMRYFNESLGLMLGFGIATLPVFFILPLLQGNVMYRQMLRKSIPFLLGATAIWLIWRGVRYLMEIQANGGLGPSCAHDSF